MNKSLVNFLGLIIPAVIAFNSYHATTGLRIGYAIAIGLAFAFPISLITRGAEDEFRKTAKTSEKVCLLVEIVVFPLSYYYVYKIYQQAEEESLCMRAWVTFLVALTLSLVVIKIVEYVVKLFDK